MWRSASSSLHPVRFHLLCCAGLQCNYTHRIMLVIPRTLSRANFCLTCLRTRSSANSCVSCPRTRSSANWNLSLPRTLNRAKSVIGYSTHYVNEVRNSAHSVKCETLRTLRSAKLVDLELSAYSGKQCDIGSDTSGDLSPSSVWCLRNFSSVTFSRLWKQYSDLVKTCGFILSDIEVLY